MIRKRTNSVGDLTAHIVPSLDTSDFATKGGELVLSTSYLFIEDDFSFKKENESIDYFFKGLKEYIRIKEYYMKQVYSIQLFASYLPLNLQHLPLKDQHLPLNLQHSPVESPTLAVERPTLAVERPTSKVWIEVFPLNHQHFPVESPTYFFLNRKVLVIQRLSSFSSK